MRAIILLISLSSFSFAQANLSDHVWWSAEGTRQNQQYGFFGMDSIGQLGDSAKFAVTIGSDGSAGFVLNRFRLDTAVRYNFPGRDVIRATFNRDAFPDYLCADPISRTQKIYFGTSRLDSFELVASLSGEPNSFPGSQATNTVCVDDLDSDGLSDIIFSNLNYRRDSVGPLGRLDWFSGADSFHLPPTATLTGTTPYLDYVGGVVFTGNFLPSRQRCLAEARVYGPNASQGSYDTMRVFFYPIGPRFALVPSDTLICVFDSTGKKTIGDAFKIFTADVDADGRNEILVGTPSSILVFRTDTLSVQLPYMRLPRPFVTNSSEFGTKVVNVGHVASNGYTSLLVTDPEAQTAGYFGGAVFLYNIGAGLDTHCVAYTASPGFEAYFGKQAIPAGDANHDGYDDFLVGEDAEVILGPDHIGRVTYFQGSSDYESTVAVREPTTQLRGMTLSQNYPNPSSAYTDFTFTITDRHLRQAQVELRLYDMLGRVVMNIYSGSADEYSYTLRVPTADLPTGDYVYELQCGGERVAKRLSVLH